MQVHDASENARLVENGFEFGGRSRQILHQRCLLAERFDFRNVAIDLKHGVITEQLHPAVYNDFAAILADMAQLAGPVTLIAKL